MTDLLTRLDEAYKSDHDIGDLWNLCEEAAQVIRELDSINTDLYTALQSMLTFYGMDRQIGEVSDVVHAEAEKAIAKARGEQ